MPRSFSAAALTQFHGRLPLSRTNARAHVGAPSASVVLEYPRNRFPGERRRTRRFRSRSRGSTPPRAGRMSRRFCLGDLPLVHPLLEVVAVLNRREKQRNRQRDSRAPHHDKRLRPSAPGKAMLSAWGQRKEDDDPETPSAREHFLRVHSAKSLMPHSTPETICSRHAPSKGFLLLPLEEICFAIRFRPGAFEWLRSVSHALRRCSFRPPCTGRVDDDGGFLCLCVRSFGCVLPLL